MAFTMLRENYEWTKDCLQRLTKAEYVGVVKNTNLKSLYLKPLGQKAWVDYCERAGTPIDSIDKPAIVYNADKVRRVERVNEARLLIDTAGFRNHYLTAPQAKAMLEQEAARQSDNIRYSRFAGILFTQWGGFLVYNFARSNIHLNVNGEKSALVAASRLYRKLGGEQPSPRFSMLVIGSSTNTALSMLSYSDMLEDKQNKAKKHYVKRHFNFSDFRKLFGEILFFPIMFEAPTILQVLAASSRELYDVEQHYRQEGRHTVNLMECRLHLWANYRCRIPSDMPVDFLCYHWQMPLIQKYFAAPKSILDFRCRCANINDVKRMMDLTP